MGQVSHFPFRFPFGSDARRQVSHFPSERRRALPAGADFLDFDCRFGSAPETAGVVPLIEVIGLVDGMAQAGGESFYLEILAKPGQRKPRPAVAADTTPHGEG